MATILNSDPGFIRRYHLLWMESRFSVLWIHISENERNWTSTHGKVLWGHPTLSLIFLQLEMSHVTPKCNLWELTLSKSYCKGKRWLSGMKLSDGNTFPASGLLYKSAASFNFSAMGQASLTFISCEFIITVFQLCRVRFLSTLGVFSLFECPSPLKWQMELVTFEKLGTVV